MTKRTLRGAFPEAAALREVLSHRPYLLTYVALAPPVGLAYAFLLQATLLRTLQPWVLRYLTWPEALFAAGMGLLLPGAVLLNIYLRQHPRCDCRPGSRAGRGLLSSLLIGLVPNALCCTPLIPALLAVFLSGAALVSVSVPVQYALGVYAPVLYAVAAGSVWGSLHVVSRRIAGGDGTPIEISGTTPSS